MQKLEHVVCALGRLRGVSHIVNKFSSVVLVFGSTPLKQLWETGLGQLLLPRLLLKALSYNRTKTSLQCGLSCSLQK